MPSEAEGARGRARRWVLMNRVDSLIDCFGRNCRMLVCANFVDSKFEFGGVYLLFFFGENWGQIGFYFFGLNFRNCEIDLVFKRSVTHSEVKCGSR